MKNQSKFYLLSLAGLLGGLAEVLWTGIYSAMNHSSFSALGGAIATTIFGGSIDSSIAPLIGLLVHLVLSVLLALGFGYCVWAWVDKMFNRRYVTFFTSVLVLALVWKFNFYVLLPVWNPDFITLLPLSVTLVSKLLFGITMGTVLVLSRRAEV